MSMITRHMGELVAGSFTVPQNPMRNQPGLSGYGLAELLNGEFTVPQNPLIKNGLAVAVNTVPGNPAALASSVSDKSIAHAHGAGMGCLAGGGCGCGGCSGGGGTGMSGLGDFTSDYITPAISYIESAFTGPNAMYWIGGTVLAAFFLFGRPESAEYRVARKQLRAKYKTYGQRAYSRLAAA
jgi:hypothetical protein